VTFKSELLERLQSDYRHAGNKVDAIAMQAYQKNTSLFLGIRTPERRTINKAIFRTISTPTTAELGATARSLWKMEYREFQYAACDMLAFFHKELDSSFLGDHVEHLLTQKSWWDSVDSLGTAVISPLTVKFNSVPLMNKWNKSENIWLNRAAIQHQRGRKEATDLDLLFRYCDNHSDSREFWITKAIGWALRDVARFNRPAVTQFLKTHSELDRVAVREAEKHLGK